MKLESSLNSPSASSAGSTPGSIDHSEPEFNGEEKDAVVDILLTDFGLGRRRWRCALKRWGTRCLRTRRWTLEGSPPGEAWEMAGGDIWAAACVFMSMADKGSSFR